MPVKKNYVVLFLIFCSSFAEATEDKESKVITQVHKQLGLFSISADKGVLGENGEQYVAAIAANSKNESIYRVVLFQEKNVSPLSVTQSQAIENNIWGWSLRFKKGVLQVYGDGSCGAICHSSATYKFQYRHGICRLIGVDESNVSLSPNDGGNSGGEAFLVTSNKSINLLTKKVSYSMVRCLSSDDNPWDCASKRRGITKDYAFTSSEEWSLPNFSPEAFSEYEENTKYLHGYINDNLKYHEN